MKIHVLGTRGEIKPSAPYHSKKSGVLIDDTFLLDCGDERFLQYHPKALLITHLHPDHAYFTRYGDTPTLSPTIYAPEPYKTMDIHVPMAPFNIGAYSITPIPTVHSVKVKSQAYLIEHKNKRILYTGDMIWIEKKYQPLLGTLDLVITEGSHMRAGGVVRRDVKTGAIFGHTGVPNLIHMFKPHTATILFVHFGSWFYKDIPKARAVFAHLAKEHDMNLIVGYDGLEITL
ncbi:MAG: MBL fold metallo-hydrolase [Candidatus Babeliales bacterium]